MADEDKPISCCTAIGDAHGNKMPNPNCGCPDCLEFYANAAKTWEEFRKENPDFLTTVVACCSNPPGDGSTCAGGTCCCEKDYICDKCRSKK